ALRHAMGSGEGAQTRRPLRLKPPFPRSVTIPDRQKRYAVAAVRRWQGHVLQRPPRHIAGAPQHADAGSEKKHPKSIFDNVHRDLPSAHRSLDEGHDKKLRVVEQETIARFHWNGAKRRETVRGLSRRVGWLSVDDVIRSEEQRPVSIHP